MPWRDVVRADRRVMFLASTTTPTGTFAQGDIIFHTDIPTTVASSENSAIGRVYSAGNTWHKFGYIEDDNGNAFPTSLVLGGNLYLHSTSSTPFGLEGTLYWDTSTTPNAFRLYNNGGFRRTAYATSATTPTGTWAVGDIIYHTDAAIGGYAGRVCTTAPSTFTPFGVLGAGYMPFAYPIGGGSTQTTTTANNLAASGGTMAVPMDLEGPMQLDSVSFWNTDAATARGPVEFALYKDATNATNSLPLVTGAVGTLSSWTPTVASLRTINVTSPPVLLTRGAYWLVIKNNNAAAQTLGVGVSTAGTMAQNVAQTKTLSTSAFGSTLDLVLATWTKIATLPGVRLNGRSFGQSTAF